VANSPSLVPDFLTPFDEWLTTPVDDGTIADLIATLKVDLAGQAAAATDIEAYHGALLANLVDDFIERVYRTLEGTSLVELDTIDAATDDTTLTTLDTNGQAHRVDVVVDGSTGDGEWITVHLGGIVYRSGGSLFIADPTSTITESGLPAASAAIVFDGDLVNVEVTGEAGFQIAWQVDVSRSRRFREP